MFRFKLEFLLRYRRQKEELAMFELAQRVRQANDIENRLIDIRERDQELVSSIRGLSGSIVPATVFSMYQGFRDHLALEEKRTEHQLQQAEIAMEKQRLQLVAASVQRKIMERFKEKQKSDYDTAHARLEQNNLDELAALAAVRKTHEDSK